MFVSIVWIIVSIFFFYLISFSLLAEFYTMQKRTPINKIGIIVIIRFGINLAPFSGNCVKDLF